MKTRAIVVMLMIAAPAHGQPPTPTLAERAVNTAYNSCMWIGPAASVETKKRACEPAILRLERLRAAATNFTSSETAYLQGFLAMAHLSIANTQVLDGQKEEACKHFESAWREAALIDPPQGYHDAATMLQVRQASADYVRDCRTAFPGPDGATPLP